MFNSISGLRFKGPLECNRCSLNQQSKNSLEINRLSDTARVKGNQGCLQAGRGNFSTPTHIIKIYPLVTKFYSGQDRQQQTQTQGNPRSALRQALADNNRMSVSTT